MKKTSFLFAFLFAGILLLVCFSLFSVSAQINDADQRSGDRQLAATIRQITNRSSEGLVEQKLPNGGFGMDLKGRFQNAMLAKMSDDGELTTACVTGLDEANMFFGRDLETGAPIFSDLFQKDSSAKLAARHGMSVREFEFYKNLVEWAAQQRLLSPNAATLTIVNGDDPSEGFNSTAAPAVLNEGGNNGTTLGQQRLNLFQFAANIWGAFLDTNVPIKINSQFNPLTPCSTSGGVLGNAGSNFIYRNFTNSIPNTFYHAALADKINGADINPGVNEINATFNSDVDTGCLGVGTRFYYGLDNSTPAGTTNLLIVLLHEFGHGLGFSSFVNNSTGAFPAAGTTDIFSQFVYDRTTGKYWSQMTDAERQASAINTGNVLWDGANVKIASGALTAGREAATGRVQLFTPNPLQNGSSVSHWDTAATPNLLMEPVINLGLPTTLDLTRQEMRDIGWYRDTNADTVADTITGVTPTSGTANIGSTRTISWTNNGGFNRNVTIELSTDGGATYPTTIASNISNTGSYSWTVPNSATTQGRVRIREFDFVAPLGASSGNFAIAVAPTSATVSISGRVVNALGRGISNASVTATGNTRTLYVRTNAFGYFTFAQISSGESYVFQVSHKQYNFAPQSLDVLENVSELNFVAQH